MKKLYLLLCLLLAAATLSACRKQVETPAAPVEPETPPVESAQRQGLAAEDLCCLEGSYTDSLGNTYGYRYQLPRIVGAQGSYIDEVNAACEQIYQEYVAGEEELMRSGDSLVITDVSYKAVTFEDILSVVIVIQDDFDGISYFTYNIAPDGSKADNRQILALFGLTETQFTESARDLVTLEMGQTDDPEYLAYYEDTRDGIDSGAPLYIDNEGSLHFIADVYGPAGAGCYTCDYPFAPNEALARQIAVLQKLKDTPLGSELSELQAQNDAIDLELRDLPLSQQELNRREYDCWMLWDGELNTLWQQLRETLPADEFAALRTEQLTWLDMRDREAAKAAAGFEGGTMQPMIECGTKAQLTRERVYEFAEMLIGR